MSQQQKFISSTPGGIAIATLSGEGGAFTPPLGTNFDFSGSLAGGSAANGAILFNTAGPGEMDAAVQVDGTTIDINGSNQLTVVGSTTLPLIVTTNGGTNTGSWDFAMVGGGVPNGLSIDILIVAFNVTQGLSSNFSLIGGARSDGTTATPNNSNAETTTDNVTGVSAVVTTSGNNLRVAVTGSSTLADVVHWKATARTIGTT